MIAWKISVIEGFIAVAKLIDLRSAPDKLTFDPIARRSEKQAQRDVDAEALARAGVTREELSRANGLFSSPAIINRRVVRSYGHHSK